MALQATEQGTHPTSSAAAAGGDPDPTRQPLAPGGMGCPRKSAVAGLPDDGLVEILSRLPAKSLCRSKCVSKGWCDLIADRLRCRKFPHTLEGFFYGCDDAADDESGSDSCDDVDDDEGGSDSCDDADDDEGGSDSCDDADDDEGGSDSCEEDDNSARGDGCEGGNKDKSLSHKAPGHFINLSGTSVPLVDPSFSFLRKQPGIENLTLLNSCNGLLLFMHTSSSDILGRSGYIVYNPATEHWVSVPISGFPLIQLLMFARSQYEDVDDAGELCVSVHLIFDPVASSHFQLIELCNSVQGGEVHTYSSETERWSASPAGERWRWAKGGDWDLHRTITSMRGNTILNKMLHLIVSPSSTGPELIVAINGKGKTCRVIRWPENRGFPVFVGESKGLLHCLSVSGQPGGNSCYMTELSVWVLEDYDAEEWNLKHTVSFLELFGKKSCKFYDDYNVATIHPDHNLVFFVQHWDFKLISYDMDRKEVCDLRTVGSEYELIIPYVPYFSETPALSRKH